MKRWLLALAVLCATSLGGPSAAAQSVYPASQDNICDPTPTEATNSTRCSNAQLQGTQNDAIESLERKVGTGASTPSAGTYLGGTGDGTSAYTAFPTPVAPTPVPTDTPAPTATPIPPVATATPRATATQEAQGFDFSTATPAVGCIEAAVSASQVDCVAPGTAITPAPTATPRATDTPIPADTPRPTDTPIPAPTVEAAAFDFTTATPVAGCVLYDGVGGGTSSVVGCATVIPTSTPASTATPRATDTPIPTSTPIAGSVPFVVFFGADGTIAQNTTYYLSPSSSGVLTPSTTETTTQLLGGRALTAQSVYIWLNTNVGGSGQTVVGTLRKNGSGTAVTCTISTGSSQCNITGQSVSISATDLWTFQVVTGATSGSFGAVGISLGFIS